MPTPFGLELAMAEFPASKPRVNYLTACVNSVSYHQKHLSKIGFGCARVVRSHCHGIRPDLEVAAGRVISILVVKDATLLVVLQFLWKGREEVVYGILLVAFITG